MESGIKSKRLRIGEMSCLSCQNKIERNIQKRPPGLLHAEQAKRKPEETLTIKKSAKPHKKHKSSEYTWLNETKNSFKGRGIANGIRN